MAEDEQILKDVLEKLAAEHKLFNYSTDFKPLNSEGANFLSVIYHASISSPNKPDINFFAKLATLPEVVRNNVPIDLIFEAEVNVYKNISTAFESLQEKYEIPKEHRYRFPKCYATSLKPNKEFIILEDLGAQGYSMYDRFKSISWDYAAKVVEELAKFHALTLAYKNEYSEDYVRVTRQADHEKLIDMMYDLTKTPFHFMAQKCAKEVPEHLQDRLKNFAKQQWERNNFLKFYGPSKWGFIIHGDFRASNIMFKRQDGKIKHLIPVDYQAIRMGSPSVDLLYFIYCGTDACFRKLHLTHLLNHYYEALASFLTKLSINPEETFSRKDFEEDFQNSRAFGLFTAILNLPVILAPSPDSNDVIGMTNKDSFNERFLPILKEYVDLNIL